jgi:hypothetical protein
MRALMNFMDRDVKLCTDRDFAVDLSLLLAGTRRSRNGGKRSAQLLAYAHPHVKHVITTTFVATVEDDSSLPKDPIAHLHRQAAKLAKESTSVP